MSLFANYHPQPQAKTHFSHPRQKPPPRIPGLGYILFPEPGSYQAFLNAPEKYDSDSISVASTSSEPVDDRENLQKKQEEEEEMKWRAEQEEYAKRARRRRELEAEEARKGEEGWVRSGGVLRDAEGNRDWARTQAIRDELKLRELEEQILDRWEKYERRWSDLMTKFKTRNPSSPDRAVFLTFEDIPWPVKYSEGKPTGTEDLTVRRVEEFLLESLTVRSVKTTKKDRVRSSLLRWHPDKLGNLFGQVRPEDAERVEQGVRIVMECLQKLNE